MLEYPVADSHAPGGQSDRSKGRKDLIARIEPSFTKGLKAYSFQSSQAAITRFSTCPEKMGPHIDGQDYKRQAHKKE